MGAILCALLKCFDRTHELREAEQEPTDEPAPAEDPDPCRAFPAPRRSAANVVTLTRMLIVTFISSNSNNTSISIHG